MNWFTQSAHAIWGLFAWAWFGVAVVFTLLIAMLIPGKERRQHLAQLACRSVFVVPGIKVRAEGLDNLPSGSCVVVANHASYIDGVLLKGYLPARFNFVIKGELRDIPVAHFLLRRVGAKFVERNQHAGSARDARQIVRAAREGESLGFFPEGTFRKEPGVGRFRPGAFVAAVRGNMPVVPVAISGTRDMLPAEQFLPRRAVLRFRVLPPIELGHPDFDNSRTLAETARRRIVEALDEPTVPDETGDAPLPSN